MPGPVPTYRPPDDGAWDSADPHFKAKDRKCGLCGKEFRTTAKRRYHCRDCASHASYTSREVQHVRFGKAYGMTGGRSPDD